MTYKQFLIVNSGGNGRVVNRFPRRMRVNEVAFRLKIEIPDGWARLQPGQLEVTLPEPPSIPTVEENA